MLGSRDGISTHTSSPSVNRFGLSCAIRKREAGFHAIKALVCDMELYQSQGLM